MTESPVVPSEKLPAAPEYPKRRKPLLIILLAIIGVVLVLLIVIQFIPVNRSNPAVTSQVSWDSQTTADLVQRACMDCHSNETIWPWYSYVAPVSWLVYYDVERGRSQLNFSTFEASSTTQFRGNPFDQRSGDLAYTLGQFLSGGNRQGGQAGFGDRGGFPNGQFPTRGAGQQQPGGGFATRAPGQQPPNGSFPGGGFGGGGLANQITENLNNNAMPPANYLMMHPEATLTDAEKQQLLQGLLKSLGLSTTQ
jgi:hypothetical protein